MIRVPDAPVPRSVLGGAMADRAVGWRTRRAGVDVCDEPGCRGDADGCLLVHAGRRRRAAADLPEESAAPAALPASALISRAHDRAFVAAAGRNVDDVLPWSSHRA